MKALVSEHNRIKGSSSQSEFPYFFDDLKWLIQYMLVRFLNIYEI